MTEQMFHKNTDKRCKCGNAARSGQRNCLTCAAEANRRYRARKAAQHKAEHNLALAGIAARVKEGVCHVEDLKPANAAQH